MSSCQLPVPGVESSALRLAESTGAACANQTFLGVSQSNTRKGGGLWRPDCDAAPDQSGHCRYSHSPGSCSAASAPASLQISQTGITVTSATVIASGYSVALNPVALILSPTGLAYDAQTDTLYVASTNDNEIFAVPHAGSRTGSSGTGTVVFNDKHLRGPLALVFAPNGNLLTSNGDAVNPDPTQPSEIVEFTKQSKFVSQFNVDAAQGDAFGIGVAKVSSDVTRGRR